MTTDAATHSHPTTTLDAAIGAESNTRLTADVALGARIDALAVRVAALEGAPPVMVPPPVTPPAGKSVTLSVGVTAQQIENALSDATLDAIILSDGTYSIGTIRAAGTSGRTKEVIVKPLHPGKVLWRPGGQDAFEMGFSGQAARFVAIEDIIFDGYKLGPVGVIHPANASDLRFDRITVQNTSGQGDTSWALYPSADSGKSCHRLVARDWIVKGDAARSFGALQFEHDPGGSDMTLTGWKVSSVGWAMYLSPKGAGADRIVIDGWTVTNSGIGGKSVAIQNTRGTISNVHLVNSGSFSAGSMTDGGGNTSS